jgi:hypothetical protein
LHLPLAIGVLRGPLLHLHLHLLLLRPLQLLLPRGLLGGALLGLLLLLFDLLLHLALTVGHLLLLALKFLLQPRLLSPLLLLLALQLLLLLLLYLLLLLRVVVVLDLLAGVRRHDRQAQGRRQRQKN